MTKTLTLKIDRIYEDMNDIEKSAIERPVDRFVSCERATKLVKGCVVIMSGDSGMKGYGNPQCVSSVCEPLGEIGLYGHNQHYKDYHVSKVLHYPLIECDS